MNDNNDFFEYQQFRKRTGQGDPANDYPTGGGMRSIVRCGVVAGGGLIGACLVVMAFGIPSAFILIVAWILCSVGIAKVLK